MFLLGILCAVGIVSQEVEVKTGFLTADAFLELPQEQKRMYAIGVVDGLLASPMIRAPKPMWLEACVVGMTDEAGLRDCRKAPQSAPGALASERPHFNRSGHARGLPQISRWELIAARTVTAGESAA